MEVTNLRKLIKFFSLSTLLGALGLMTCFAQDVTMGADEMNKTMSTPSTLSVKASDLPEGDLVVTIPDSLVLRYNSTDKFVVNEQVSAKGNINPAYKLEIGVTNTTLTFTHDDADFVTLTGTARFGTSGKEEWTVDELKASFTTLDERALTVEVAKANVDYIGGYTSHVDFAINLVSAN